MQPKYKRILLKLSGEVLKGSSSACHDEAILADVAGRLAGLVALGVEVGDIILVYNQAYGVTTLHKHPLNLVPHLAVTYNCCVHNFAVFSCFKLQIYFKKYKPQKEMTEMTENNRNDKE